MAGPGHGRGTRARLDAEIAAACSQGDVAAAPSTDPALWTTRPVFGVAGGPVRVVLTDEGDSRAFSVGAQVRRGGPAEALEALWVAGGEGHLTVRGEGARLHQTELGRVDQIAWGHLRSLGLVTSFQDHHGDGVRLTEAGRRAAQGGVEERARLLDRCRRAAWEAAPRVPDKPRRMTAAQQRALRTIREAGGTVVRFNFGWDGGIKLNLRAVDSLREMGLLLRRVLPPRGPRLVVPVEYTLTGVGE